MFYCRFIVDLHVYCYIFLKFCYIFLFSHYLTLNLCDNGSVFIMCSNVKIFNIWFSHTIWLIKSGHHFVFKIATCITLTD